MEVVYAFIGRLPEYVVQTVHQTRCFFDGPITLLIDDLASPYLERLKKYNVQVLNSADYTNQEFITAVNQNMPKFCIAQRLGDRKLLFIRAFERFFVLENWMKSNNKSNILFLELDMLIYFSPSELLPIFSQREMTFTHTQDLHKCSAFFYVRDLKAIHDLNTYFIHYINSPENNDCINEMNAIHKWLELPNTRDRVWMLPGLWKEMKYHKDVWENFENFEYTLFDGLGIGIMVDGPDETHREEWLRRGKIWWGSEVRYTDYQYEWKVNDGKRILYLIDKNQNQYKVQSIHVHNKNVPLFLSKPLE